MENERQTSADPAVPREHLPPNFALVHSVSMRTTAKDFTMKRLSIALAVAALAVSSAALPGVANAAGCLKGAAVGGIAGHLAGHHTLAGAAVGCAISHHEAAKHAREERDYRYR